MRKVWRQMLREGCDVARCTVARLMRNMGLSGCRDLGADARLVVAHDRWAAATEKVGAKPLDAALTSLLECLER